jgi:hypothetical protein
MDWMARNSPARIERQLDRPVGDLGWREKVPDPWHLKLVLRSGDTFMGRPKYTTEQREFAKTLMHCRIPQSLTVFSGHMRRQTFPSSTGTPFGNSYVGLGSRVAPRKRKPRERNRVESQPSHRTKHLNCCVYARTESEAATVFRTPASSTICGSGSTSIQAGISRKTSFGEFYHD